MTFDISITRSTVDNLGTGIVTSGFVVAAIGMFYIACLFWTSSDNWKDRALCVAIAFLGVGFSLCALKEAGIVGVIVV